MAAAIITPLALALSGCAGPGAPSAFQPDYQGVDTRLLAGDLVNFHVTMRGARDAEDVDRYAECAAAQYNADPGLRFCAPRAHECE